MEKFTRVALTTLFVASLAMMQFAAHALESAESLSKSLSEPWFGDYSAMKKDKTVRVLVPFSLTSYYIDQGKEKGVTAEYMREFEAFLNKGVKKELDKVRVVLIPSNRDQLLSGLVEGHGDMAVANMTITPERLKQVDFSNPVFSGVQEILLTSKDQADFLELKDLAGIEVHVRESSSYFSSLQKLNEQLQAQSLDPITIVKADENLEDEDLIELVHTGVIPAIVMDDYKARLWIGLFNKVKMHDAVAIRENADIAWAFRKESPELKSKINQFLKNAAVGTMLGNVLKKRYFSDINSIVNPKVIKYQKKLNELIELFNKYGEKYKIDPMLLAAQAFQESRFNNNARSRVGAVGIMQVLPSTATDPNVNIKNIKKLENNIEAGAKYMRFLADQYFADSDIPDLQQILFVFASYNAGPNRVARVRKKATDPNKWFESVEWEVARAAGAEPVKYVKNIYIYYILFKKLSTKPLKLD
ncbi:MAG: transglycosylase SLT domain-containing protein [Rhizobiaceae bacterium]